MKIKRNMWFKILAAFIAFVMVIQILPLSVLANTKNHKFSESKIANVISKYNEENKSSNKIVTEMKDKRTEYSKTYLLDDNSYYCITVANPIHYLDEEKWTNLDERLDTIPNTTEEAENILIELSNAISQCGISLFSDGPTQISSNNIITNAIDFFPLENNSVKVTNGYQTSARFNGAAYLLVKPSLVYNYSANNLLIENANLYFQINTSNNKALKIKAYEENCGWESNTNLDNSYKNIEGLELLDSTSLLNSQTCKMNITDVFSKWERETLENNGVKLKFDISRDTVTVSDFCISVQYKNLSNDNTNYTYHTLDLGKAGTISINDITNTMTIKQDIIGINTNVLPVNISRTINSVLPTLHANGNVSGHWNYGFALELNDDIMTWKMPDGYNVKYQKIDKDIVNGYQKWEQITDGDYSDMMHTSSNPLDSNPYLFCNNNLISNNDIYASWSTHDNGLSFFDSGFEIGINKGFLSRPLCELYAAQLIKNNGTYNYDVGANLCGMDKERIAINLFSNAVGYYSPKAINKVNANWGMGWLDSLSQTMNGKITVRSNEKEYIVNNYKQIWLAAPTIKNHAWSSGIFITV